jgi:hypothetical protein
MAKEMDVIAPQPRQSRPPEYKTSTLVKLWWIVFLRILKQTRSKIWRNKKLALLTIIILVAALVAGLSLVGNKDSSPLPKSARQAVNFPLYYPSHLPEGYKLEKGSAKAENNIVFYSISNNGKKISVSEQAAPINPPDFEIIQKSNTAFRKINVTGGQAIYGVSQKVPAAIMITNTTMINISGSSNIPLDLIGKLTQSMSPLPS